MAQTIMKKKTVMILNLSFNSNGYGVKISKL